MGSSALDSLLARILDSSLLDTPVAENGVISGHAALTAARAVVAVTVDPELDEGERVDEDALIHGVTRVLSMDEPRWRAIVDRIATEIENAVDDGAPIVEQVDLRIDLEATSVVVFADAVLVAFEAGRQFPDSQILVQLDEDLDVADIEVRERDDETAEPDIS